MELKIMGRKVFISSTYSDLKEERKKIWELLEKFEVTILGMEEFGARKSKPLETCLNEVAKCDIYIAIIGMRYGSEDSVSKKSFTEREYEKAIELNKDVLIYLVDENNYTIKPILIQYNKIEKLNRFKKYLKANHTVDFFYDSNSLISKLEKQLVNFLGIKKEHVNILENPELRLKKHISDKKYEEEFESKSFSNMELANMGREEAKRFETLLIEKLVNNCEEHDFFDYRKGAYSQLPEARLRFYDKFILLEYHQNYRNAIHGAFLYIETFNLQNSNLVLDPFGLQFRERTTMKKISLQFYISKEGNMGWRNKDKTNFQNTTYWVNVVFLDLVNLIIG